MTRSRDRKNHDMGPYKTAEWLEDWCNGNTDLTVESIQIDSVDVTNIEVEHSNKILADNQSDFHFYLKLLAMKWLANNSKYPETIESEVICYVPNSELVEKWTILDLFGKEIDIGSAHILYDNAIDFPLSCGTVIRLDLHSFDMAVEVGATQPANLIMPLIEGLADQSLWLPYPRGSSTAEFQHRPGGWGPMQAYLIRLQHPSPKRRKRTPVKNRRGPHPYPIGQWAFMDWYINKHGTKAAARAHREAIKLIKAGDADAAIKWITMSGLLADVQTDFAGL